MPELPEVEVTRMGIAEHLDGARIESVAFGKPLRWPLGVSSSELVGKTIMSIARRGKYLIFKLNQGVVLVHLGMSGSLRLQPRVCGPLELATHEHFGLRTTSQDLVLLDPRRFGAVVWGESLADARVAKLLSNIGVEPLGPEFTPAVLRSGLRRSKVAVKQLLLGGKLVCGVGNIYASEALFLAKVRPTRAANTVTNAQSDALFAAIQTVLGSAIRAGGSSLRDFKGADGNSGHFQTQTRVYGRAGLACYSCSTKVVHITQGQRSSFYCPVCQKA